MASQTQDRGAVMITGASTGIGKACAMRLDKLGFQVFAGVRNDADGGALAETASERLARQADKVGKSMQGMGRSLTKFVTLPLLAVSAVIFAHLFLNNKIYL